MRVIDDTSPFIPEINPEKVRHIAALARELLAGDEEEADTSVSAELEQFLADLDEDETAAVVALLWVGRGDYDIVDWPEALRQARARRQTPIARYLLGEPLLPDFLEDALAAFGES
jgi:hypothetical protein